MANIFGAHHRHGFISPLICSALWLYAGLQIGPLVFLYLKVVSSLRPSYSSTTVAEFLGSFSVLAKISSLASTLILVFQPGYLGWC
jgi:hypothetical protein